MHRVLIRCRLAPIVSALALLLALSTTIFGGIGGYLMRVYKTIAVGADLQKCYDKAARADTSEMRQSLERIEKHLGRGEENDS